MNKAFFLDRDGTINVDYNFVHTSGEWTWCKGAVDAIKWMNEHGFKVIVVTNQSGIVRGHYTVDHVETLHQWVDRELEKHHAFIDDWYIAPYHPDYDTVPARFSKEDRKPDTGMFLKAAQKHEITFAKSYMAGDKVSDLRPAVKLGITPFFIRSRHESSQDKKWLKQHNIPIFPAIKDMVESIETR